MLEGRCVDRARACGVAPAEVSDHGDPEPVGPVRPAVEHRRPSADLGQPRLHLPVLSDDFDLEIVSGPWARPGHVDRGDILRVQRRRDTYRWQGHVGESWRSGKPKVAPVKLIGIWV